MNPINNNRNNRHNNNIRNINNKSNQKIMMRYLIEIIKIYIFYNKMSVRKRIFESSNDRVIIKKQQLSVPNVDVNQFYTDQSEIIPAIEIPIKDELLKSNNE